MDNLLNIFDQYTLSNSKVEIIEETSKILSADIPQFWKKIFLSDDLKERKAYFLQNGRNLYQQNCLIQFPI